MGNSSELGGSRGENERLIELSKQIQQLQRDCAKYVTELPLEEIQRLLSAKNDFFKEFKEADESLLSVVGNYFFVEANGEIVAAAYALPLLDDVPAADQIYKIGGLSIKDYTEATPENRQLFWELAKQIMDLFENQNARLIMITWNQTIEDFLIGRGLKKLSYDECKREYPAFLAAYKGKTNETDDYYQTKTFFVRTKK